MDCKHCGSIKTVRNGHQTRWKARRKYKVLRWLCMTCGRSSQGSRRYEDGR